MSRGLGIKDLVLNIKNLFLDIIFPIECLGCGREGEWLCDECQNEIGPESRSLCGENLDKIFTFYSYDNEVLKKAIHGLKYKFVEDLARSLGKLLIGELEKIRDQIKGEQILIPVPLHEKRFLERGFNQAELLTLEISKFFGWPVENRVLARTKRTASQVSLTGDKRRENICGAFAVVNFSKILNKKIILIDDVLTTGATMEECAKVLKRAGAGEVLGIALAKG